MKLYTDWNRLENSRQGSQLLNIADWGLHTLENSGQGSHAFVSSGQGSHTFVSSGQGSHARTRGLFAPRG